jgi:hypothetical protein
MSLHYDVLHLCIYRECIVVAYTSIQQSSNKQGWVDVSYLIVLEIKMRNIFLNEIHQVSVRWKGWSEDMEFAADFLYYMHYENLIMKRTSTNKC